MKLNTQQQTEAQVPGLPAPFAGPQLELALAAGSAAQLVSHRPRRQSRASWWFQRMRQIVDHACDWEPALVPPPEQILFPHAHRVVSLTALPGTEQGQLCE